MHVVEINQGIIQEKSQKNSWYKINNHIFIRIKWYKNNHYE